MGSKAVNEPSRRVRLDELLVEKGLAQTRNQAQAIIRAGKVKVGGRQLDKPGMTVGSTSDIIVDPGPRFVGRGGEKLAAALDTFGLSVEGATCLDVGASTGGFTDALLQRGAVKVFAVDVGRAQLAWRLRTDPRVVSLEKTDIRRLDGLPEAPGVVTVDVAFISLSGVLPRVRELIRDDGACVALVKPQFEAGASGVGKGGIVRDPEVHRAVLTRMVDWCIAHGWSVEKAARSALQGADGNREFFLLLRPSAAATGTTRVTPDMIAELALS